jgi:myo-inositol-1(or 4)-monophosphatase
LAEIEIEFVRATAKEAGLHALEMLAGMQSEYKADSSYVTNIDREIERFVQERLAERYPDFAFLGEEFGWHGRADAPLWAVDPIDGTTNMVFGVPFWGVSIGLIVGGEPVAGAFYLPCTDELFWGVAGEGAFCNGVPLQATDRETIHREDTLGFTSAAVKNLDTSVLEGRVRCLGSIAADIAYTARGALCCLVGWNEGAYDMAAALCCAREAGCVAAYLTGEPLDLRAILRDGKTQAPFVVAPPRFAALLQSRLLNHSR